MALWPSGQGNQILHEQTTWFGSWPDSMEKLRRRDCSVTMPIVGRGYALFSLSFYLFLTSMSSRRKKKIKIKKLCMYM